MTFGRVLCNRVTQVRHGKEPVMSCTVPDSDVRRVSVSFRHVPEQYVHAWDELSLEARAKVRPYVDELGAHSAFFRDLV
jgi:alkylated DNA repair protein (DNA oxidative demethylase)